MEKLSNEEVLRLGLGKTWTYIDSSTGKPVTVSWEYLESKLSERKHTSIISLKKIVRRKGKRSVVNKNFS